MKDYLSETLKDATLINPDIFSGQSGKVGAHGGAQWAVAWTADADGFLNSYCNTIPTPDGGTHEFGPAHRAACAASRTTPSASARASARRRSPAKT